MDEDFTFRALHDAFAFDIESAWMPDDAGGGSQSWLEDEHHPSLESPMPTMQMQTEAMDQYRSPLIQIFHLQTQIRGAKSLLSMLCTKSA